jgi:hypothetical protein
MKEFKIIAPTLNSGDSLEILTVRQLHEAAMQAAQQALIHQVLGNHDAAEEYNMAAMRLEELAAHQVPESAEAQPTRGILYRSAATLALRAGEPDRAMFLIEEGLKQEPPLWVQKELMELRALITEEATA